jgi:hypothetical protein
MQSAGIHKAAVRAHVNGRHSFGATGCSKPLAEINSMDCFIQSKARNQLITAELETCDESLLR